VTDLFCIISYFLVCLAMVVAVPASSFARAQQPGRVANNPQTETERARAAALFESGQNAHQSGDFNRAVEIYHQALKLDPSLWQAQFQLSAAYLALNKPAEARESMLKVLDQLKEFSPSNELNRMTARANAMLGEIALAESKPIEAESYFRRAVELDPQASRAGLAEALLRLGKTNEGITEAKAAIETGDDRAGTYALLGGAYAASGKFEEALPYLNEALKRDPKNIAALRYRSDVYLARKDLNAAIADLRAVMALEPDNQTMLRLAGLLAQARKYDEATAIYQQVLQTDPSNNEAKTAIAALMIESGKGVEAIAQLESLIKAEPNRADLRAQLAELYLPARPEKALEQYQVAAKIEPSQIRHQIGVGSALVKLRRFQEAAGVLQQALAQNPKDDVAYFAHTNLATAFFEMDDFANAAREFVWILNHQREQKRAAITLYFLGICFDKLGDYEQALKAYKQFLTLATSDNQLEIDKVKLRLPSLERQIREGKGKKKQ
jgi:tetratricopeptide (TPR) repeat protein